VEQPAAFRFFKEVQRKQDAAFFFRIGGRSVLSTLFQNSGNVSRWTAPSGRGSVRNVFLSRDQRERSG